MRTIIRSGRFYFWPIIGANMLAMAVAVGGDPVRAAAFSLVISSLASFGFLLNDLWDRDVDRVNGANHFESSDNATIRLGVAFALGFLLAGLAIAWSLGLLETRIATVIAIGLGAYTVYFRKILILPNLAAAVLSASPLWTPLVLWPRNVELAHWAFVIAFVLVIAAREMLMDVRDRPGDVIGGRATMATVFGPRAAKMLTLSLSTTAGAVLLSVLAMRSWGLPMERGLSAAAVTAAILFFIIQPAARSLLRRDNERSEIQRFVLLSRAAMLLVPILIVILW